MSMTRKNVIEAVCRILEVDVQCVMESGRMPRTVFARWLVAHLCRELCGSGWIELAEELGRTSHTGLLGGDQALRRLMAAKVPIDQQPRIAAPYRFAGLGVDEIVAIVRREVMGECLERFRRNRLGQAMDADGQSPDSECHADRPRSQAEAVRR